ncbi:RagB/SusD family nutrient uptake outer membrane protein [Chitinophaga arvensicola]|uniref:Starch-binding associating with outer membrane n=1 Tax=Chitinophaga arvensicola TaxID=29529 RepID=A0A1I0SBD5_9BACT|nr:RagB/SusD family nutrient uptake outer membrane protein [Chitinophaga arvensicola]SEW54044.1 Starch-binding associating with outer membrane [Chitinophaga arvensicola]
MKKSLLYIGLCIFALNTGCNDKDFLNVPPSNVLQNEQLWNDEGLILSVLADLYDRYPDRQTDPNNGIPSMVTQTIDNWAEFARFDEAFASENGQYWRHSSREYNYVFPGMIVAGNIEITYWDYAYIRELNIFIDKCATSTKLKQEVKDRFIAEARYLRASVYFEEVKRVGGVPLILQPLEYDYKGDPAYLQHARAKESEIYDFVISEMDSIKKYVPASPVSKTRVTAGLAQATKIRAALYAGSIAKHGVTTPQVSLPGGEVGIPSSMAAKYYTTALQTAQELIGSGSYSLYKKNADNVTQNFVSLFIDKGANPEVIFAKDYKLQSGRVQPWTLWSQPRSNAEEQQGGRLNPSLNLVQSFELLDNSFAPLPVKTAGGDYIYYNDPQDLFANRDPRLAATVILPGTEFKDKKVDIWAGYIKKDGSIVTGSNFGAKAKLDGVNDVQVVGFDGPVNNLEFSAQTGFIVRKYMDPTVGSGRIGTQSEVWWIRYRYAEVLLNAAEAAFELGQAGVAADYINQVRERAGFKTPLTAAQITFGRIVHERKVELAFEGHEFWDMKRWRLAHIIWNGRNTDLTLTPGDETAVSTRVFGLWPYKIYDPGSPNNGKYVFKQILPGAVTAPHEFRLGNYYGFIMDDIRNNNPKIVKNPNQ